MSAWIGLAILLDTFSSLDNYLKITEMVLQENPRSAVYEILTPTTTAIQLNHLSFPFWKNENHPLSVLFQTVCLLHPKSEHWLSQESDLCICIWRIKVTLSRMPVFTFWMDNTDGFKEDWKRPSMSAVNNHPWTEGGAYDTIHHMIGWGKVSPKTSDHGMLRFSHLGWRDEIQSLVWRDNSH